MSTLTEFSEGLSAAVEKAGAGTILVDSRKRYPASGIAYAEDLVLTADHVVTREENIKVILPDGKISPQRLRAVTRALTSQFCGLLKKH